MPIAHKIYEKDNLIVTRSTGVVTLGDITATLAVIEKEIIGWPNVTRISDFSQVEVFSVSPFEIRDVAERKANILRRLNITMRTIIIATSDEIFGLVRAYCAQAAFEGQEEATAVRCPIEAADWIGMTHQRLSDLLSLPEAA